jgi:hypothetical protein
MSSITGRLVNASREKVPGGYVLIGKIYDDTRKKYADGVIIHTSRVMREEGDVVWTRTSVYRVDSWRKGL